MFKLLSLIDINSIRSEFNTSECGKLFSKAICKGKQAKFLIEGMQVSHPHNVVYIYIYIWYLQN